MVTCICNEDDIKMNKVVCVGSWLHVYVCVLARNFDYGI